MYLAENWKDYEILDTGSGEKLERWGDVLLIRPDPQVIWTSDRALPEWEKADGRYLRSNKGGGSWENRSMPETWSIGYRDLTFRLKPFTFKHTGLFPEQAVNWDWFREKIRKRVQEGKPVKILNLFAYTGGATLAAAAEGASVTHVDASKGMVEWAKENAEASGLRDKPVRYLVDDCMKFVERELRRGNRYDGIIMDPPSYGRGPKGEIWKLEDTLDAFMRSVVRLLSDDAIFFLLNSYTTGYSAGVLQYFLETLIVKERGGVAVSDEIGLPITRNGCILPCGSSGRWSSEP